MSQTSFRNKDKEWAKDAARELGLNRVAVAKEKKPPSKKMVPISPKPLPKVVRHIIKAEDYEESGIYTSAGYERAAAADLLKENGQDEESVEQRIFAANNFVKAAENPGEDSRSDTATHRGSAGHQFKIAEMHEESRQQFSLAADITIEISKEYELDPSYELAAKYREEAAEYLQLADMLKEAEEQEAKAKELKEKAEELRRRAK